MSKRTSTAILGGLVVLAGVGGYVYADIQDVVPGFLTENAPIVGSPAPQRESVQLSDALPARMLADVPPIAPSDLDPVWKDISQAGKDQKFTPSAYVVDAVTGNVLLDGNGQRAVTPASVIKILTAVTAVNSLDPDGRLATSVFIDEGGTLHLVGEGDLLLGYDAGSAVKINGRAGLEDLAKATAEELSKNYADTAVTSLVFHPKIFEGETREAALPAGMEHWVGRLSAFAVDRGELPGEGYQPYREDPGAHVAEQLQKHLNDYGVNVQVEKSNDDFDQSGASLVAQVESATISEITRFMLANSDNTVAEQLCRMSSKASGAGSTWPEAAAHVRSVVADAGIYSEGLVVHDCSGLNENNKMAPRTSVEALRKIWKADDPALAQLMRDLPVGQFTGTLDKRFGDEADGVRVQAKTGSLDDVSSLAGYATTKGGRVLIFHVQSVNAEDGAFFTRPAMDEFALSLTRL
ncbi:MAG: D-alanyl-D-alanine carboxypeptidase/D-alanyl-D-alanine-endopeptidase [Actinomycetaceae bacterium]|nr:D-alanyl-D-alanine carboxypeptidase/D-alanyl-D-alanine-endopeptidase [Actinomycetaceae bacterium]